MERFESTLLNIHGTVSVVKIITHETVQVLKLKLLDGYLLKLKTIVNELTTDTEGKDNDTLLKELEDMNDINSKILLQYRT